MGLLLVDHRDALTREISDPLSGNPEWNSNKINSSISRVFESFPRPLIDPGSRNDA